MNNVDSVRSWMWTLRFWRRFIQVVGTYVKNLLIHFELLIIPFFVFIVPFLHFYDFGSWFCAFLLAVSMSSVSPWRLPRRWRRTSKCSILKLSRRQIKLIKQQNDPLTPPRGKWRCEILSLKASSAVWSREIRTREIIGTGVNLPLLLIVRLALPQVNVNEVSLVRGGEAAVVHGNAAVVRGSAEVVQGSAEVVRGSAVEGAVVQGIVRSLPAQPVIGRISISSCKYSICSMPYIEISLGLFLYWYFDCFIFKAPQLEFVGVDWEDNGWLSLLGEQTGQKPLQ